MASLVPFQNMLKGPGEGLQHTANEFVHGYCCVVFLNKKKDTHYSVTLSLHTNIFIEGLE